MTCGSHTWYVKAVDNSGNSTDSNTFTYTITCNASGSKFSSSSSSSSSSSLISKTTPLKQIKNSTYRFLRQLDLNSKGNDVTELQKRLTSEGVYSGPITGFYGPMTREGVRKYQTNNNISPVGRVGPQTLNLLNSSSSTSSSSQGFSLSQLVEVLINLGIIAPDKADLARTSLRTMEGR